jgi:hypothetical protein
LSAEALYLAQEHALKAIDELLHGAGVEYAVIKGAASRLVLYENPAIRACFDLDLLVHPEDRVRAASALADVGFIPQADERIIGHELLLSQGAVDIDLHWGLLREGRLQHDLAEDMLGRRSRENEIWTLNAEDALFVLLVHSAFSKHLAGWEMGLHRVVDIVTWLRTQSYDWEVVCARLEQNGVKTAAWATLRWVDLLTRPHQLPGLDTMMSELCPGRFRKAWLDRWLRNDNSERTSNAHWARLLGFSLFLHDTPGDAVRALAGRRQAHRRSNTDLKDFRELLD